MAGKKKSTVKKVVEAVHDAASAVVKAAEEHVIQPVGKALGIGQEPRRPRPYRNEHPASVSQAEDAQSKSGARETAKSSAQSRKAAGRSENGGRPHDVKIGRGCRRA